MDLLRQLASCRLFSSAFVTFTVPTFLQSGEYWGDYYFHERKKRKAGRKWGDGVSRRQTIFELFGNLYPRPYICPVMKRKGRGEGKGWVLRVCLAVNGPRKRGGPPNFRYRARCWEFIIPRRGGGGPCVTHVHFNAITASSSVRGSKWAGRNFFLRFRVSALLRRENFNCASTNQPTLPPTFSTPLPLLLPLRRLTRWEEAWRRNVKRGGRIGKWRSIEPGIRSKILTLLRSGIRISEGQLYFHIRSKRGNIFLGMCIRMRNLFLRISTLWSVKICVYILILHNF